MIFIRDEDANSETHIFIFSGGLAAKTSDWYEKWTSGMRKNWIFFVAFVNLPKYLFCDVWSSSYLFTCLLIALRSDECTMPATERRLLFTWLCGSTLCVCFVWERRVQSRNETILCAFRSLCLVGHWATLSIGLYNILWLGWMERVPVCV